jgi:hypothetical protein
LAAAPPIAPDAEEAETAIRERFLVCMDEEARRGGRIGEEGQKRWTKVSYYTPVHFQV